MKTLNPFKISLAITAAVIITLFIPGCHKDNTAKGTGSLYLHLHTNIDSNEVDNLGQLYPDANGRKMSITEARMYLSNISILSSNGSWTSVAGVYVLQRNDQEEYYVAEVPAGTYTKIAFNVGVDSIANGIAPSGHTGAKDSVLSTGESAMWFGSTTQGYIFLDVKGQVDTSSAHDGSKLVPYSYKIGSNSNLQFITMPDESFTVAPNGSQVVHIVCDYGTLLEWQDASVAANLNTDTYTTNPSTAATVSKHFFPAMFRYEY